MLRAIAAVLLPVFLGACATSTNLLNETDIAGLRIDKVEIQFKPDAQIWWGKAEREFVEAELAKKAQKAGPSRRAPSVTDASDTGNNAISSEYSALADSPAAKVYTREALARLVKQRLEKDVVPAFKGTRPVTLEITVVGFVIPSAVQRLTLGGTPMITALRVLKDSKTGAELAKLDQATAAGAGQGVLGVAIEQALPDLEIRLMDVFVTQTQNWLNKK